jgi:hypothetical protein
MGGSWGGRPAGGLVGPGNPCLLFSQQRTSVPPGRPLAGGSGRAFSVNRVVFLFSSLHNNNRPQAPILSPVTTSHGGPGSLRGEVSSRQALLGQAATVTWDWELSLPTTVRPQREARVRNSNVPAHKASGRVHSHSGVPKLGSWDGWGPCGPCAFWDLVGPSGLAQQCLEQRARVGSMR